MTMTQVVWIATILSMLICLGIGLRHSLRVLGLADILPLMFGRNAKVASYREFSASTVAASISLATVVVAFFELVPGLGLWLLWPAITTAAGLLVFSLLARRVWQKMSTYEFRPTMHAYLGTEFGSSKLALVASACTAVGYLTAFATELTVGSRFMVGLLPGTSPILMIAAIAIVTFAYTGLGGFRTVVVTDRLQMEFIWLLLAALATYYVFAVREQGLAESVDRIPTGVRSIAWSNGLLPFVIGIAVMNLLTYIGNMGLWQRIAGSEDPNMVARGLWQSVVSSLSSWSLLALAAVGAFMVVSPVKGENLLVTTLKSMEGSTLGLGVVFCVVLGLYGAMLSTASTQLMAVSHTIYEDIIAPFRKISLGERIGLRREAVISRVILAVCALASVGVVEFLRGIGFSVADMAFAVYGAALGLVPPIVMTLFMSRAATVRLSRYGMLAVTLGFLSCWSVATYGRIHGDGNLVFLSPLVSTGVATTVMLLGLLLTRGTGTASRTGVRDAEPQA